MSASAVSGDAVALRAQAAELGRIARVHGAALALGGAGAWPDRPRHGQRFTDFDAFHRWASAERERQRG